MSERLKQLFDEAIAINQEARGHLQHTLDLYKSAVNELNATRAECEGLREALKRIESGADAPSLAVGDMRKGLFCGVEDRDLRDRYDGAEYGWEDAAERYLEWAKNEAAAALSPKESPNG